MGVIDAAGTVSRQREGAKSVSSFKKKKIFNRIYDKTQFVKCRGRLSARSQLLHHQSGIRMSGEKKIKKNVHK